MEQLKKEKVDIEDPAPSQPLTPGTMITSEEAPTSSSSSNVSESPESSGGLSNEDANTNEDTSSEEAAIQTSKEVPVTNAVNDISVEEEGLAEHHFLGPDEDEEVVLGQEEDEDEDERSLMDRFEDILKRGGKPMKKHVILKEKQKDNLLIRYTPLAVAAFNMEPSPGMMRGYLVKQGLLFKTWRQRYFILAPHLHLLFYYENAKTCIVKGVIELRNCDVFKDRTRGKEPCFQISYPKSPHKRAFYFHTTDTDELRAWMRAIGAATLRRPASGKRPKATPLGSRSQPMLPPLIPRSNSQVIDESSDAAEEEMQSRRCSLPLRLPSDASSSQEVIARNANRIRSVSENGPKECNFSASKAKEAKEEEPSSSSADEETQTGPAADDEAGGSRKPSKPSTPGTPSRVASKESNSQSSPSQPPNLKSRPAAGVRNFSAWESPQSDESSQAQQATPQRAGSSSFLSRVFSPVHKRGNAERKRALAANLDVASSGTVATTGVVGEEKESSSDEEKSKGKEAQGCTITESDEIDSGPGKEVSSSGSHESESESEVEPPVSNENVVMTQEAIEFCLRVVEENRLKVMAQVEPHGSQTAGWKLVREEGNILISKKEIPGSPFLMGRAEGMVEAKAADIIPLIVNLEYDQLVMRVDFIQTVNENIDIVHLPVRSPFRLVADRDFVILRSRWQDPERGTWVIGATSIPLIFTPSLTTDASTRSASSSPEPTSSSPLSNSGSSPSSSPQSPEVTNDFIAAWRNGTDSAAQSREPTQSDTPSSSSSASTSTPIQVPEPLRSSKFWPAVQRGFVRGEVLNSGWVVEPLAADHEECFCTWVLALDPKGWVPSWLVNKYRANDMYTTFGRLKQLAENDQ